MATQPTTSFARWFLGVIALLLVGAVGALVWSRSSPPPEDRAAPTEKPKLNYQPRDTYLDTSGYLTVTSRMRNWPPTSSLEEVAASYAGTTTHLLERFDGDLANPNLSDDTRVTCLFLRAMVLNYDGRAAEAYPVLEKARALAEAKPPVAEKWLYTIIYFQGVTALRRAEDENCLMCRGESSCILPISPAAVHKKKTGSRLAVRHFTEYLNQFPDDLEVRWLLNVAHMTLGEWPAKVDPKYVLNLDHFLHSEFDIGRFRDVADLVGVNHVNQQGGGIMEDFDNDGLLDIVTTSNNLTQPMTFYHNRGDGTFEDRTEQAGLTGQLGGLYCVQGDYNNDGNMDVFVPRGAWVSSPVRPSLLRNKGDGTFTDVTQEAGLGTALNSLSACWADYDNDGLLDLFVPCGPQPSRLYHNKGDGTFEEVAAKAGVAGGANGPTVWRSAVWIDYDRDGYPDLFVNTLGGGKAILYHNNRNGTFTDVTAAMGIDGPKTGFSCWAFDYDNDGWPDIFATCYEYPLVDIVNGLLGKPHHSGSNRLYHNLGGKRFQDVTREAGLDMVFATMGSNFGDFDNDGYLDMYLGTGGPDLSILVPHRMFKNVGGKRFAEITGTAGTAHIQKGHSVACGDWDRNGSVDIFVEMGGATPGTEYHNVLFQNPGQGNNWLTVKLVGKKTNRAAIGARIKVVTAGDKPLTVYREVTSGSSFGANPLQQTIGLAKANRVALLEVYWPTSRTTQTFRDLAPNQAIEITEFAANYRKLDWKPIPLPK